MNNRSVLIVAFGILTAACGIEPKPAPAIACGPMTCANGCCQNGTCRIGTDDLACGKGGVACQDCYSAFTLCLSTKVCGTGTPAPTRWALTVVDATVNALNGTMQWDPDGTPPDTFLVVDNQRTPTVANSTSPRWMYSADFTQEQLTQTGIGVQFFDDDGATNDKMSQPRTVKFTQGDLNSGIAQFMNWDSVLSVTFTLQRQ